jgi:hypothetical protein
MTTSVTRFYAKDPAKLAEFGDVPAHRGPRSWVHYLHVQLLVATPEGNIFAICQADRTAMPARIED